MEVLKGKKEMDIFDKGVKYAHSYWENKIGKKIEELKEIADEDNKEAYVKIDVLNEILEEEN